MAETAPRRIVDVPCRYYRVYTDPGVPCEEHRFHFVERTLPVPADEAALVLVDVWSVHYIDTWLQRAAAITRERIVPLRAARPGSPDPSPYITERQATKPKRNCHARGGGGDRRRSSAASTAGARTRSGATRSDLAGRLRALAGDGHRRGSAEPGDGDPSGPGCMPCKAAHLRLFYCGFAAVPHQPATTASWR